jgi:hypothetical protein
MKLPGNAVGISDVIQFRDCPQRFEFDMRRWTEEGEAPEATNPNNVYGSAIHHAIAASEEGMSDGEAVQSAMDKYGSWLDPEDLELLIDDLATYHLRDYAGVKTVASEENIKVPLFEWEGETIYYRFTLDRLYVRLDNPTSFVHIDYKSSKHKKSEAEVHKDVQLWTYNFAIFEQWPEAESLLQIYDQLRFGSVPTRKNAAQRAQIRKWLVEQITTILRRDEIKPRFNQWCPWCPLLESCPEPRKTAEFARARIEALAPGGVDTASLLAEPGLIDTYAEELEEVETTRKCLDRFEKSVKGVIRELPSEKRRELGFELSPSSRDVWTPQALRAVHEAIGDDFYLLIKMTKTKINEFYAKDAVAVSRVLDLAEKEAASQRLNRIRN